MNVDAPILRVHTHTAWVPTCEANCSPNVDARVHPAIPTIWATTRTRHGRPSQRNRCQSTYLQRVHGICERPDEPKHIHADPRKSTSTHEVLGAQILRVESHVYSWAPIMSSWTATKRMWATTENMWSLTHLGWTTTANRWAPTHYRGHASQRHGHPYGVVDDRHAIVGACGQASRKLWAPRYCEWSPTFIRGRP